MIKDATRQIIQRTLQSSFDREQFLNFTKNLLNHIDESKARHFRGYIKEQFKKTANIIKTYERLGTYTDPDNKKIDILVVYLEKDNSIDRARTSLRNFVADYLKGRDQKDAALVAFVSPKKDDWRFSLVKMDYKFTEGANGKVKVKEEFTPARRWSFLVGAKESSHTAQSRLAPILEDDANQPTLEQLEDAFNIEIVTKEFFERYRELFLRLKDNLDEMVKNDAKIKADFAQKDIDTIDFAKKLLGQIVFLYFLQKKGWFGVERDADWGTGPKDFLRQLFDKKHSDYKNFFNEILEPMFYEALALEREDDYYGSFKCKIPFLNGGLFDPIGSYDWVHTDINLDNKLFSNSRPTKQGDIGDGILDIFDRYNFTVREDEPLEKEVAVDPEMLGKVFENLLEVKDRKSKGTYYTPREIVHYMCEQSLINYLATDLSLSVIPASPSVIPISPSVIPAKAGIQPPSKSDIEIFIKTGDQILESEILAVKKNKKSNLPKSIIDNAKLIDQKLAEIKVCDPAIGSGAFPVGMMGKIVNARLSLNPFLCQRHNSVIANEAWQSLECAGRTAYDFKMQAITNSIYGVDIDPGAVEIAKLRLWLSLVVDENDIKQIKPLPNLDYKIMQGNSLLEEFEGIKLFDESIIPQDHADREAQITRANDKVTELQREFFMLHSKNELSKSQEQLIKQQIKDQQKLIQSLQQNPKQGSAVDLFNQIDEIKAKWDELTELHKNIINETNRQEKKRMLDRASELEWQFIETTLKRENKSESLKKIEQFKKKNTKPFFLWHLHFADVFQGNGGFDVVIANPPYGAGIDELTTIYAQIFPNTTRSFKDIYKIFIELGISKILKPAGILCYIIPNTLLTQPRYKDARQFLLNYKIKEVLNLGEDVFEQVIVSTCVIFIELTVTEKSSIVKYKDLSSQSKFNGFLNALPALDIPQQKYESSPGNVFVPEMRASKNDEITLGNILDIKDAGINYQRVNVGLSNKGKSDLSERLLYEGTRENSDDVEYWKGCDINSYYIAPKTDRFVRQEIKLNYNERVILNKSYFKICPKIIWRQTASFPIVAFDQRGIWYGRSIQSGMISSNARNFSHQYLIALLNSSYLRFIYSTYVRESGRVFPQVKIENIKLLPIKNISPGEQLSFIEVVDKILAITKSDDYLDDPTKQSKVHEYEHQINQMVYELYDLTPEEIKIVEGSLK